MDPISRIETIAIGDELLTGRTSDTNSTFVANELFKHGLQLVRVTVIPDDEKRILSTLKEVAGQSEAVVVFGGLGPTSDDLTAECVAKMLSTSLVEDPSSKSRLIETLLKRNRGITPQALKQVLYPQGTTPLRNENGFAPGFFCRIEKALVFFLPGVPNEMALMFKNSVLPELLKLTEHSAPLLTRTWKCLGIPESELQRLMDPIEASFERRERLGYRTRFPENLLTLYSSGDKERFQTLEEKISVMVKEFSYTDQEAELEELIIDGLRKKKISLALAESCTGGLVIQRLTRVPGASEVVFGGATVYQCDAKRTLLNVTVSPEESISAKCSEQLAKAIREKSGCELVAAVTGFMGPESGTAENPPGTLFIYVQYGEKIFKEKRIVIAGSGSGAGTRDRLETQWGASTHVLREVWRMLEKQP